MFAELLILNAVSEFQVPPSSIKMGNSWFRMYGKMSSGNNLNMIWVFFVCFLYFNFFEVGYFYYNLLPAPIFLNVETEGGIFV